MTHLSTPFLLLASIVPEILESIFAIMLTIYRSEYLQHNILKASLVNRIEHFKIFTQKLTIKKGMYLGSFDSKVYNL